MRQRLGEVVSLTEVARAPKESHLRILQTVRQIPPGYVSTYGQVAEAAGQPGRARLVGYVLGSSPLAADVPWHRVVGASGCISERRGDGPTEQRRLLAAEGVELGADSRIDLLAYQWWFAGFPGPGRQNR
jgi:methylated-DNA-protein-cysteine methyltransferase-like protein